MKSERDTRERGPAEIIRSFELSSNPPRGDRALFDYADALRRVGRCREALQIFEQLETLPISERKRVFIFIHKGYTLKALARWKEAEDAFREASKLDQTTGPRVYLAGALAAQERFQEAVDVLEGASHCEGDTDEVLVNLSLNLRTLGRLSEAKATLERALLLSPSYPGLEEDLADITEALAISPPDSQPSTSRE